MPDDWDFSSKRRTVQPQPIITYVLGALCILLTLIWHNPTGAPALARLDPILAPAPSQIWEGAYWGILTTFFVHGDIMHILFNMMVFIQLGRIMEASLPRWGYLLFLLAAAAVSFDCELAVTGQRAIGASGVVYAMFGLMWTGQAKYREWRALATQRNMNMFLMWGVICIIGTVAGFMHIANAAHFGGLLFGLSVGALFLAPHRKMIWAVPLALLIGTASLSLFWLPWSGEWHTYRAGKAFDAHQYRTAIDSYHRSLRLGGNRYINWENIKRAWGQLAIQALSRGDVPGAKEAIRQVDSAARLEGPDPSLEPEKPAVPSFHMPGTNR